MARAWKSPLRWLCGLVWIVGALQVMAALDRVPDPPAANPDSAQFTAAYVLAHTGAPETAASLEKAPAESAAHIPAAQPREGSVYKDVTVRIDQASDPSPPFFA